MIGRAVAALALVSAGVVQAASPTDLRDYALASCLIRQDASAPLRDEGYRLADVVIGRAGIGPFTWRSLQHATEAALARRGLLMVHGDGPVATSTHAAPLATCLEVIDMPGVRRAMAGLRRPPGR